MIAPNSTHSGYLISSNNLTSAVFLDLLLYSRPTFVSLYLRTCDWTLSIYCIPRQIYFYTDRYYITNAIIVQFNCAIHLYTGTFTYYHNHLTFGNVETLMKGFSHYFNEFIVVGTVQIRTVHGCNICSIIRKSVNVCTLVNRRAGGDRGWNGRRNRLSP